MSSDRILKVKNQLTSQPISPEESNSSSSILALKIYDLDFEFEVFDTSHDDHLNSSIDSQRYYFYRPNSQPRKTSIASTYESMRGSNENDYNKKLNLYTINNYRARELSWSVKHMATINQYDKANVVLVPNKKFSNAKKLNKLETIFTNFIKYFYTKNREFEKNSIINCMTLIIFAYLCISLIETNVMSILKNDRVVNSQSNNDTSSKFILLIPPKDFIVKINIYENIIFQILTVSFIFI